ncbi:MAG: ABC transporter ATP-binding protein [Bacteroidia bacterium]
MKTKKIVLQAENISIGYTDKKSITVAEGLNLSLHKGSFTTLLGVNGIGKSTLLRTLSGIQLPLAGKIIIKDRSICSYNLNQLAQELSLVLTEALPKGNLSVYELVALGRQPYTNWIGSLTEYDNALIKKSMRLTDTTHLGEKKLDELSDGQLQNVLIARALAQDTSIIILDEPTTHLDLPHKVALLRLLKNLAQTQDKCILYSTHDMDLALQMSEEIIIMKKGHLEQGSLVELNERGSFDTLFNDDSIVYDKANARFIYR